MAPNSPEGGERWRLSAEASVRRDPESTPVDARQDELMSQESSEGRPPPKRYRTAEWTVLAVVGPLVLLGVAVWALTRGIDSRMLLAAVVMLIAVIGATSPVWGAGLLRGKEEREARRRAESEIHPGPRAR